MPLFRKSCDRPGLQPIQEVVLLLDELVVFLLGDNRLVLLRFKAVRRAPGLILPGFCLQQPQIQVKPVAKKSANE